MRHEFREVVCHLRKENASRLSEMQDTACIPDCRESLRPISDWIDPSKHVLWHFRKAKRTLLSVMRLHRCNILRKPTYLNQGLSEIGKFGRKAASVKSFSHLFHVLSKELGENSCHLLKENASQLSEMQFIQITIELHHQFAHLRNRFCLSPSWVHILTGLENHSLAQVPRLV